MEQYFKLTEEQLNKLRTMCHSLLLNIYYKSISITRNGDFKLKEKGNANPNYDGRSVTWQELCLFILPKALGIKNIILNIESPMHPADFIINEFEKSKNMEKINEDI
jgi:hypothetical protein